VTTCLRRRSPNWPHGRRHLPSRPRLTNLSQRNRVSGAGSFSGEADGRPDRAIGCRAPAGKASGPLMAYLRGNDVRRPEGSPTNLGRASEPGCMATDHRAQVARPGIARKTRARALPMRRLVRREPATLRPARRASVRAPGRPAHCAGLCAFAIGTEESVARSLDCGAARQLAHNLRRSARRPGMALAGPWTKAVIHRPSVKDCARCWEPERIDRDAGSYAVNLLTIADHRG